MQRRLLPASLANRLSQVIPEESGGPSNAVCSRGQRIKFGATPSNAVESYIAGSTPNEVVESQDSICDTRSEFEIFLFAWTNKLRIASWLIVAFFQVQELGHAFVVTLWSYQTVGFGLT